MKKKMKTRIIRKNVKNFGIEMLILIDFWGGSLAEQAIAKIKAISLYMKDFNKIIFNCQKEIGMLPKKN